MNAELARTVLLIGLVTCGALVLVLSFMPWVEFTHVFGGDPWFSLKGTELSRMRGAVTLDEALDQASDACTCRNDFGDGYVVAMLGGITFGTGAVALLVRGATRPLVAVGILASIGAFAISGYNAIAIWEGIGRTGEFLSFQELDGEVRPELYSATAAAGLAAILGGAVFATMARRAPEEPLDEDEEIDDGMQLEEVNEAWA